MNQLKWGVLLSYFSMGLGIVLSLVYTPFMLRLLGQAEWGLYSLVASVVGYLSLLSFGFGGAYVRFHARAVARDADTEVPRLNGLFLIVFVAIGIFTLLAGALLIANIRTVLGNKLTPSEIDTARILMGLMTFTVAISFPASVFNSFLIAEERFFFQRMLSLVLTVVSPVSTLVVLLLGYKSVGMAAVAAVIAVGSAAVNVTYCTRRLNMVFAFRGLDPLLLKEVALFSSYIFLNMIVDQVNWNVDKFILGRVGGTVMVAVYAIAAQLNSYYISLSTVVSSVFVPRVNRLVATADDNVELTHLFTRVGRVQFMILMLVCSGLIVFGRPFITAWAGPDYLGAYPMLVLLMVPVTIPLIQNLGIEIQKARNMHQFRSWLYLGIAVANVALSIPLAQRYGGAGAAAGTGVAVFVGNGLIMNWYYARRIGLDMRYFWRSIIAFLPALVPIAILGGAIMGLVDLSGILRLTMWGVVYVAAYCVSMWFFGMNSYERTLIGEPAVRMLRRWGLLTR